jgi:hypothetical protein
MTLCSDRHEEVCYEGRSCPACDIATELAERTKELKDTERELDHMADQHAAAEKRFDDHECEAP